MKNRIMFNNIPIGTKFTINQNTPTLIKTSNTTYKDNQNNITRFAVIGTDHAARSGNDKTALMFEVSHQPGALADVMNVFKRSKLNLTFIESFPRLGGINEYIFFVEFEGHPVSSKVRRALDSLDKKVVRRKVLGAYENKEPVG